MNSGGTLPVGVVLTAIPGTTGTVMFSCTTNSPTITCNPVPSTVNLTTNGPTQVAIVVNTFCRGVSYAGMAIPRGPGGGFALLLLSSLLAGLAWAGRRNPRWAVSFGLFLLIALGGVPRRAAAGGLSAGNQRDDERTDRVGAAGRISRQQGPRLCQAAAGWTAAPIGVGFAHQFIS